MVSRKDECGAALKAAHRERGRSPSRAADKEAGVRIQRSVAVGTLVIVATATALAAQTPAAPAGPGRGARAGGQGAPAGPGGQGGAGRGEGGFTSAPANPAKLLFRETWATVMAQPIVQSSLSNQSLRLHVYGNASEIRKTTHAAQDEHYTYTGETQGNWAITVSDPKNMWDLTGDGRFRMQTRNSGLRTTHIVIKTTDGRYFASEDGNPESSAWIERDYIFRDMTWRLLLMTDTPSNASNQRQPNAARVPLIPTSRATPDLTKVEEVGFSDLQEGGWIPSTSRVRSWEVWGKVVPR
jgi:hypothetical protein